MAQVRHHDAQLRERDGDLVHDERVGVAQRRRPDR
jgi:hypothetical protein